MRKPPQSAVLEELAMFAAESDSRGVRYAYSEEDLLNALVIFNSIVGTKMYELFTAENQPFELCCEQATKYGEELRLLVYTFTNIDTHEIAKKVLK